VHALCARCEERERGVRCEACSVRREMNDVCVRVPRTDIDDSCSMRRRTNRQRGELDVCSLCLEAMCIPDISGGSGTKSLTICTSCNNGMHGECYRELIDAHIQNNLMQTEGLRCPSCRATLAPGGSAMRFPKKRRLPLWVRIRNVRKALADSNDLLNAILEQIRAQESHDRAIRASLLRSEANLQHLEQAERQVRDWNKTRVAAVKVMIAREEKELGELLGEEASRK
jgi:hypothetical protein